MTIRDEEIRLKRLHIQTDLPDTMGAVDNTQDGFLTTNLDQSLERKPDAGVTHDRIENSRAHREPLIASPINHLEEPTFQLALGDGILESDLPGLQRAMLLKRDNAFLDGAVDGLEIDEGLSRLEIQVIEHGRDAASGVLDEDTFVLAGMDELGHLLARHVQQRRVLLSDIGVWAGVGQVQKDPLDVADGCGMRTEGTWAGMRMRDGV